MIEIIQDRSLWDDFVLESPDKFLFHTWDFLKIMEKHSGSRLLPFGIFKKEKLICLFPLFYFKKFGVKFLNSQPPGSGIPYAGFLRSPEYSSFPQRQKESYMQKVADEIQNEVNKISPNIMDIRCGPGIEDIRPFQWSGYDIDVNYTYVIDLTRPLETIWESFDRKCRTEIRSTEKHNKYVKETDDLKKFYSIMKERYTDQNLTFSKYGPEYFHDILQAFRENVKMYFLYNDDKIISLAMNYEFNGRLAFWKGWVNLDKTFHGNEFLTWEFIQIAKLKGLKSLELQGANTKRLCFFKSKFNPVIETYFSIIKKDTLGWLSESAYSKFVQRS
jgi:hypothetical protein